MSEPDRSAAAGEQFTNILVAVAVTGLLAAAIFAAAWYRAATSAGIRLEDLSVEERQLLAEGMRQTLPGVYVNAWFEPRIGYTFQPRAQVELPYDTFVADELGYRNRTVGKPPRTFRVVFVGDSWTFGHGVTAEDSFPAAFERIAGERVPRRIEAWTLAHSGYNAVNQLAALWFFVEKLEPDAVVFCPSTNDNDSSYSVLPNGSLTRLGKLTDELGDPHHVSYRHIGVDSYRYRQRWREAFRRYREAEAHLHALGIPSLVFFVAHWPDSMAHHFAGEAGLEAPYLVNPEPLRTGRWLDPEYGHGTAAANRVYGRIVYQGLARLLGWPQLPADGEAPEVELFHRPPPGDWEAASTEALAVYTERFIEESFEPPQATDKQCAGPMSCETGRIGRASTVLVRRRRGAERLAIELAGVAGARHLYPLGVTASIPSPSGGTRARTTVPAAGAIHRFTIAIPTDVPPGTALDVVFEADRATAAGDGRVASSVFVRSIGQL